MSQAKRAKNKGQFVASQFYNTNFTFNLSHVTEKSYFIWTHSAHLFIDNFLVCSDNNGGILGKRNLMNLFSCCSL